MSEGRWGRPASARCNDFWKSVRTSSTRKSSATCAPSRGIDVAHVLAQLASALKGPLLGHAVDGWESPDGRGPSPVPSPGGRGGSGRTRGSYGGGRGGSARPLRLPSLLRRAGRGGGGVVRYPGARP